MCQNVHTLGNEVKIVIAYIVLSNALIKCPQGLKRLADDSSEVEDREGLFRLTGEVVGEVEDQVEQTNEDPADVQVEQIDEALRE